MQWKLGVLTTGPLGKSHLVFNFLMLHIYSKRQKFKKTKHIGKDMEELEVPNSSVRLQKETIILDDSVC